MKNYRHWAFNPATGEVVNTTNGNHLKRWVKAIQRADKGGRWIFAHGTREQAMAKFQAKSGR